MRNGAQVSLELLNRVITESKPPNPTLVRRRVFAFTLGGGAQLIAITLLVTAWAIYQGRLGAHQAAEIATTNLSHTLGDNFASTIEKIDLGLLSILDEISRQQKLGMLDERQIVDTISRQDARNPDSAGYRVYDSSGRLVYGQANVVTREASIAQLEPFVFLRDNPDAGLFVSPPIYGTVIQQWIVSASRRIANADGSFGGVVASGIANRSLLKAFSALNIGSGGIVALYHTDNQLAARYPAIPGLEDSIGKAVINDELRGTIAHKVLDADIIYIAAVDGVMRSGHAHKIAGQPYYVLVAFAEDDYLAAWRHDSLKLGVLVCLVVALILLGMRLYYRSQVRRLQLLVDLAESNRRLTDLSATDALTGIANRRRFDEALEREWRRSMRSRQPLALAMMDVDFFKNYNDHYGHQGGDECLRAVAQVLNSHIHRAGDLVARYGGEEFVLLGAGTDTTSMKQLVESIRGSVEELALPHKMSPLGQVTISIGVASVIPNEQLTPVGLVKMADEALYAAKEQGRNRVMLRHAGD
jgi:diguanylate cyclase (GGDEF)-like protein